MDESSEISMLSILLAVGLLAGGEPPPKAKDDPQNKFEPRSAPGAGQKFLQRFVGDWEVVKIFHPRNGEAVKVNGECKQTMIHEGRFLQSEFAFKSGDNKTTGLGLIGFEAESGKFTSVGQIPVARGCHCGKAISPSKGKKSCCSAVHSATTGNARLTDGHTSGR